MIQVLKRYISPTLALVQLTSLSGLAYCAGLMQVPRAIAMPVLFFLLFASGWRHFNIMSKHSARNGASTARPSTTRQKQIVSPPLCRLDRIARLWGPKTYRQVFSPALADILHEYYEACALGDLRRARWIHLRGVYIMVSHMLHQAPFAIGKIVRLSK